LAPGGGCQVLFSPQPQVWPSRNVQLPVAATGSDDRADRSAATCGGLVLVVIAIVILIGSRF
jgi:hypothetical protein